jgi:hypothetical protein
VIEPIRKIAAELREVIKRHTKAHLLRALLVLPFLVPYLAAMWIADFFLWLEAWMHTVANAFANWDWSDLRQRRVQYSIWHQGSRL